MEAFCPAVNEHSGGRGTVMDDYGCDNGRCFCVLLTRVENLSSPRGRKTNEEKINSRFAILQSLLLLCDVLTESSVLSACMWIWIPVKRITHAQQPTNRLSSTPSSLYTHTHIYSLTKGVLRGTPGHCSGFLLYFMIWGVIEIHKQCCRHLSVFQKKNEYIK